MFSLLRSSSRIFTLGASIRLKNFGPGTTPFRKGSDTSSRLLVLAAAGDWSGQSRPLLVPGLRALGVGNLRSAGVLIVKENTVYKGVYCGELTCGLLNGLSEWPPNRWRAKEGCGTGGERRIILVAAGHEAGWRRRRGLIRVPHCRGDLRARGGPGNTTMGLDSGGS